ncbi:hypothetical protein L6164_014736 [Bauhinia variegata]|nr:hypothetical protein L6164_014736 [Bauhinia variegata]
MANNITASADPSMQRQFSVQEASNALQAGLLCTQSSIALRPSMSEVVQMLTNKDYVVPSPKQPPFLNASVLSPEELSTTYSIKSASSTNRNVGERPSFYSTRSSSHSSSSSTAHFINVGDTESTGSNEPTKMGLKSP